MINRNSRRLGRKNAPIVAALLDTGLCADCTMLEADGDNLIMYRPAQGGNITAKIKCLTKPQMATVRTKSESSDILAQMVWNMIGYESANELYANMGVDTDLATEKMTNIPVSLHCWQSDDVKGFDTDDPLTGCDVYCRQYC